MANVSAYVRFYEMICLWLKNDCIENSNNVPNKKNYQQNKIWLKKCPGHLERQNQITKPILLKTTNFTMVSMNFNLTSDLVVENDIYVYTTILPYTENDPNVDRG